MLKNICKKRSVYILMVCLCVAVALALLATILVVGINAYVVLSVKNRVLSVENAVDTENVDCIVVLGCRVYDDGSPSAMLKDRLSVGVDLYYGLMKSGNDTKLLMSGDHGTVEYNEVYTMKQFALAHGVESSEVFMDHAGFSTYESICRAKEIFGAKKIIIVTQEYHLYRALYIAESFGIEAYGVAADLQSYSGQIKYSAREILARNKDFFSAMFKPEPTYLGDKISLKGSGDVTNDY